MLKDSHISPTVLVTVHRPLGKVKVLALLDTAADANFIKKDLADTLGLPLYGSLNFKVRNSTYTDASSITQPVTFNLEGSLFCVKCNSTPNLPYPFILGFPWLKECFLNFDHIKNRVTFTCNNAFCYASLNTDLSLSSPTSFQLTLLAFFIMSQQFVPILMESPYAIPISKIVSVRVNAIHFLPIALTTSRSPQAWYHSSLGKTDPSF
ncbi:hypothetical protein DSO57_1011592 [Entomophthora muscae]|uniref:Uncharacterized protein n=1 Tax=Entomophthora muscae TaxID=34485 RepID=A0ACC2THB1_9FUNG|nr:hypothetical protein DSO57_1011592 [Entomophthora muscae]